MLENCNVDLIMVARRHGLRERHEYNGEVARLVRRRYAVGLGFVFVGWTRLLVPITIMRVCVSSTRCR